MHTYVTKCYQFAYPGNLASQSWNFAIVLPLIIGHMVPEDDPHWECYLLLLQIVKYCTARVTIHLLPTLLLSLTSTIKYSSSAIQESTFCQKCII